MPDRSELTSHLPSTAFETVRETDPDRLNYLHLLSSRGLISDAGLPVDPWEQGDYAHSKDGRRVTAPYEKEDSPSRLASDAPYNVTLYNELRSQWAQSTELLVSLREAYLLENGKDVRKRPKPSDLQAIYGMSVLLPNFMHVVSIDGGVGHRPNGTVPSHVAMLRQAMLGIGSVFLNLSNQEIKKTTGAQIAETAEEAGILIGRPQDEKDGSDLEQTVCPAAAMMIEKTSDAFLDGQPERSVDATATLEQVGIGSVAELVRFQKIATLLEDIRKRHNQATMELLERFATSDMTVDAAVERHASIEIRFAATMTKRQRPLFEAVGIDTYQDPLSVPDIELDKGIQNDRQLFKKAIEELVAQRRMNQRIKDFAELLARITQT